MDLAYYFIAGALILFSLIIFIFRINKAGDILVSIRTLRGRFISGIVIGIIMIINAITSKTFIGAKGVSFLTVPFYIPLNKISSYTIEDNRLILNRVNMADYRISINIFNSNKIIKVMKELKIDNKCKKLDNFSESNIEAKYKNLILISNEWRFLWKE